jgi:23S rRNA (uracil1939-C5)-methyltransferase
LQDIPHSIKIIEIELVAAENASAVAITASKPLTTDVANRIIKNLYMIHDSIQLWWKGLSESRFSCLSDASASLFYSIDNRLKIYFEPGQFIQVNREVNDLMIKKMVQLLSLESKGTIVDLFCGSGNLSLPLAQYFDHVIGVEGVRSLVNKAIENARDNVVINCKFVVADLSNADSLNGITEMVDQIDVIVLDPPRDGAMAIMPWVANAGAKMVLYISCHPSTMIRDAKILKSAGYRMVDVGILDMFPHTAHVESISLFVR